MVELKDDALVFSFPDVHPNARLRIQFQRTLRIPDSGKTYALPPGLGAFPMRHVDDFAARVPPSWSARGGVMLPMYQSEALWILFQAEWATGHETAYPFAIKVAAGKINALTGDAWTNGLHARPQDYAVAPMQPWLDGFSIGKGVVRQFVAMPLGSGYSAEEQITGSAEHGGLQIMVAPMRRDEFERRFPKQPSCLGGVGTVTGAIPMPMGSASMGLAPGGRMKQEIFEDRFGVDAWDVGARSRCFVHLVNTLMWQAITDAKPPSPPVTAGYYARFKLPWFDYYAEGQTALDGGAALKQLRSVLEIARGRGDVPLPENEDVTPDRVVRLGPPPRAVRDGGF